MSRSDLPVAEFGFPGPLRDALVAAICAGTKTSTTSLLVEYEIEDEPIPTPGEHHLVVDSLGEPVTIIEITDVQVTTLGAIDLRHAIDEGKGFTTVEQWRREHEKFWRDPDFVTALGRPVELTDSTQIVIERFRVVEQ
ncbi:ASCH domain-containing protein [Williamsia sp. CHRR-6]|uniref:ASCH domain-containing protein n=1 Tax=Williamsia sp. CHRR-6 TaxID=2835871 RepID=UPI001BD98528|nr:ASCH domain-containing protein [Williamsia sp. CHRR-6]MBT0568669.1 ASCH domain-containing protein [Williamsia sp. CHRR-6]